jgi:TorA maturation chaperone TorD
MQTIAIPQITERLQELPTDRLAVVYDFVSYLAEREKGQAASERLSEAFLTMLASEAVLRRDWDLPEEDMAWADL